MWVETFEVCFVVPHKSPFIWLPVFLWLWQLTVEKLCRLRPLHSGLTPAVLKDLQWADVSQSSFCQCWMTTLTRLKPAHRALLYSAVQKVTMLLLAARSLCFNVMSISIMIFNNWDILIISFPFVYEYLFYVSIAITPRDLIFWYDLNVIWIYILKYFLFVSNKTSGIFLGMTIKISKFQTKFPGFCVTPGLHLFISGAHYQQALKREEQNITQLPNCLLPLVPLRKLTEALNGEELLRGISRYREVVWSPQQVSISTKSSFLAAVCRCTDGFTALWLRSKVTSFTFHSPISL